MKTRLFRLLAVLAAVSAIGLAVRARASQLASIRLASPAVFAPQGAQPQLDQTPLPLCPAGNTPSDIIFSEDFDAGMVGWTEATTGVFSTTVPYSWALANSLPGSRSGSAVFAPDPDAGQCGGGAGDASRLASLFSPLITLPESTTVGRLAFNQFIATELSLDGGSLKVSVNDGPYIPIDPSDFTFNAYNASLAAASAGNTNPLAGQPAFSGSGGGGWIQSIVDLSRYAGPGDTIRLRFDFGANGCGGVDGWYTDDVKVYYCENQVYAPQAALSASSVQASILPGSDVTTTLGLTNNGDSPLTWSAADGAPAAAAPQAGEASVIVDGGFEGGSPNPDWAEYSLQGTPQGLSIICSAATCGEERAYSGSWFAWFGSYGSLEETARITQTITIPAGEATLTFYLRMEVQDPADVGSLRVLVDGAPLFTATEAMAATYSLDYVQVSVDASAFADGEEHNLVFEESNPAGNPGNINFFVDDVALDVTPALACTPQDIPWLSISPKSGAVLFANTEEISFAFDAAGLGAWQYTGAVCLTTNDPDQSLLTLPVTLTVGASPTQDLKTGLRALYLPLLPGK